METRKDNKIIKCMNKQLRKQKINTKKLINKLLNRCRLAKRLKSYRINIKYKINLQYDKTRFKY